MLCLKYCHIVLLLNVVWPYFIISELVDDLLRLFAHTRSVTTPAMITLIHALATDFPKARSPTVRHVLLLTIFCSPLNTVWSAPGKPSILVPQIEKKLIDLQLLPVDAEDLKGVLMSSFAENDKSMVAYGKRILGIGNTKMNDHLCQVALRCLTISCKVRKVS